MVFLEQNNELYSSSESELWRSENFMKKSEQNSDLNRIRAFDHLVAPKIPKTL